MVFHWSRRNSKSLQLSRTFPSILIVFNYVVVWMISILPLTFSSSHLFSQAAAIVIIIHCDFSPPALVGLSVES